MSIRLLSFVLSALLSLPLATAAAGQNITISIQRDLDSSRSQTGKHTAMAPDTHRTVVWLSPRDKAIASAQREQQMRQRFRMVQKDKQFSPRLLVVPTGASVEFPNLDPFFHNVFSLFNGRRFDLGLYEAGSHRSVRFDRDGISYIFCNIHPEMGAVIISLETPFFSIASRAGQATIANVPSGEYTLNVWSEDVSSTELAAISQAVHVKGSNIVLPAIHVHTVRVPAPHENKFGEEYKPAPIPY